MKIVEQRLLRGPNLYSRKPCLLAIIDLEDLDDRPSTDFPQFIDRLHEGTYMAHIVEHVLIELQCLAGTEIGFGRARMVRGKPRHYRVVCQFEWEKLVIAALPVALNLVRC